MTLHSGIRLHALAVLLTIGFSLADASALEGSGPPPLCSVEPTISGAPKERETLTAIEGTWSSSSAITFTYQWSRCPDAESCRDIPDATKSSYVATAEDVGLRLRLRVFAQNNSGTSLRTTALTAPVQWAPPLNVSAPWLSGSGREAEPLTANLGTWVGNITNEQLVWHRCNDSGCALMNLSAAQYTPTFADVGSRISIEVIKSGPGGTSIAMSSERLIAAMPPLNVQLPEVQGSPREGVTLVASPGLWNWNVDRLEYQWLRCDLYGASCTELSGATADQWTPRFEDAGARLRVRVIAVGAGGVSSAVSGPSDPVQYAPPAALASPALSGLAVEGEQLTANVGTWSGAIDAFSFQWLSCDLPGEACVALAGQNGAAIAIDASLAGRSLRAEVIASGPGGAASAWSDPKGPVRLAPPRNTAAPLVSGLPRDGELLTAAPGTWAGTVDTFRYRWVRCASSCETVGTSAESYRLVAADIGSTLRVEVTALNADGSAMATSAPTAPVSGVPPSSTQTPWLSGVLSVGQVLSGGRGEWTGTQPMTTQYQWLRCDALGTSCAAITGATSSRYLLTEADLGHSLRLEVSSSNNAGSSTATSPSSGEVQPGYAQEVLADAPLGYWRFGERGGTVANDASGNGADGTYFGGAAPGVAGVLPDGNRAAAFDGVNDRADFGDHFDFDGASPFTFEAWIRPTAIDTWHRRIFEKEEKSAAGFWEGYRFAINSSLGLYCERWQAGSNAGLTSVPITALTLNAWQHVACTYDGVTMRVFVNGVLAASKPSPNLVAATTAPFTIGSFSGGGTASWFAGDIDEVAVYGSALGDARLIAHVSAAASQPLVTFAPPAIEGIAVPARTVTASTGTWRGALPVQFERQWLRCDPSGSSCSEIAGATAERYQVTTADAGARLRVRVTATNSQGPVSATSNPTAVVPNVTPLFSCTEAEAGVLSGAATAWAGPPETANGTVVLGAQGSGELAIPFTAQDSQPVTIWARVRSQTRSNNALRVTMGSEGYSSGAIWDIPISPVLRWHRVTRRGATGSETSPAERDWPGVIAAGANRLRLQGEKAGVEIDAVCISSADVEPDERLPEPPVRAITRSVKDFGAVGNGVADDTASLQAAFNALTPGEALLVPAGRYRFTSTLNLTRHQVSIVGEGPASVLFADFPATATGNAINVAGGFEGANYPLLADALETDRELLVGAATPVVPGDVVMLSSDPWGPTAPNLTTLFFRNRQHLLRVTAVRTETAGKILTMDRPLQSEFRTAYNARVQKFSGLRQVVLSNFAVHGTANALSADNADTNLVLVNRCDRCFFADLEFKHARKSAIEIARALDSSAIRVHVSDATDTDGGGHGYGVAVTRSQGVIVRDSLFDGVIRHGVPISWGSRETFVFRNVFDRSTPQTDKLASIDIHGQDDYGNLVEANLIAGGTEAIIVGGGGTSHGNDGPWNVLRNNRVENAVNAILVFKSTYNTVIDQNTVVGSTGYALRVESGSDDALVCGNLVEGYVGAAVRISAANRAQVIDNRFSPGSGPAVELLNSTGYVVSGNELGGASIAHPGTGLIADNF